MGSDDLASHDPASAPLELPAVTSFAAVYRREYRSLVALAWGLTGSRETGEDIAQEALLSLHKKWGQGDEVENAAAYVRRTCANLSVSWVRRRVSETRMLLRLEQQPSHDPTLDDSTTAFWAEVRRLPRRQAQAVALFYGYGMTVSDIAETLQMSSGTAKTHLYRGRRALAVRLGVDLDAGDSEEVR